MPKNKKFLKISFLFLIVVTIFFVAILVVGCSNKKEYTFLSSSNWNPRVKDNINNMFKEYGKYSNNYNKDKKPYAVFDFDNTTSISDAGVAMLVFQAKKMCYAFDSNNVDEMKSILEPTSLDKYLNYDKVSTNVSR